LAWHPSGLLTLSKCLKCLLWGCAVRMNGEQLTMTKGETELEMVPYVEGGEMVLLWQKHREGLGNAVEITTGQSPPSS
jgi:hypothetical protein